MKVKLIINPNAGIQKKSIKKIKQSLFLEKKDEEIKIIVDFFKKQRIKLNISQTKKEGDGIIIASKSSKYNLIIVAGGDGTINEVINGLNYKTKLGIIPTGSENVFAKEMKIPTNIVKACEVIIKKQTKLVDIGIANKNKFVFSCGIGFDAHAITKVKTIMKKFFGKHSYKFAGIKTLFEHRAEKLSIKCDDKQYEGYFAIISNLKKYGGNIILSPNAEVNDGKLDVSIFTKKDFLSNVKYLFGAVRGNISKLQNIKQLQAKKIIVTSKKNVLYHTDAEIKGTTPVSISVLPSKLKLIVP